MLRDNEHYGNQARACAWHFGGKENAEIDNLIIFNLEYYKSEGPEAIDARIRELDRGWDIERTLELNAAAFALTGARSNSTRLSELPPSPRLLSRPAR